MNYSILCSKQPYANSTHFLFPKVAHFPHLHPHFYIICSLKTAKIITILGVWYHFSWINSRTIAFVLGKRFSFFELLLWIWKILWFSSETQKLSSSSSSRADRVHSRGNKKKCISKAKLPTLFQYYTLHIIIFVRISIQENRLQKQPRHEKINTTTEFFSLSLFRFEAVVYFIFPYSFRFFFSLRAVHTLWSLYFQNNNSSRLRALICSAIIIIQPKELNV